MILFSLADAADALDLGDREHIALVGGGGKTTLWYEIGTRLAGSTVLTTTTKMGADQHRGLPVLLDPDADELTAAAAHNRRLVVWRRTEDEKAFGMTPERCDEMFGIVDNVVAEADGARRRPFKAPADYEPVVPSTVTTMVSVIGGDALGRVIADQCHRPLRVAALAECSAYERLTPSAAATVLLHERGALKEKPAAARLVVAITKVDDAALPFVEDLVGELANRAPSVLVVAFAHHGGVYPGPGEG